MSTKALHRPVLLNEVIANLNIQLDAWYIDATFGRGGHTKEIIKHGGKVIAFDVDFEAIEYAKTSFVEELADGRLKLIQANFTQLKHKLIGKQLQKIQGILFDFGTSVDQLKSENRGFSFEHPDSELDMRMDQNLGVKAKDLLALLSEKELTTIFYQLGGEKEAKKIAKKIVQQRKTAAIQTVDQLIKIIQTVKIRKGHLHPATKVFQALRIVINQELESIKLALPQALEILNSRGRIITIAFHEGEDRIVKRAFKKWQQDNQGKIINKKVIVPSEEEIQKNPKARSAKMRIFEKL